ncbi:hypothetical protein LT493_33835 [Streptomyces tricolor]|nr:hypothetical protein [Streptomyces tricolor]
MFVSYLRFKARGVPRRLLEEFNSLITWDGTDAPPRTVPRLATGAVLQPPWTRDRV